MRRLEEAARKHAEDLLLSAEIRRLADEVCQLSVDRCPLFSENCHIYSSTFLNYITNFPSGSDFINLNYHYFVYFSKENANLIRENQKKLVAETRLQVEREIVNKYFLQLITFIKASLASLFACFSASYLASISLST